MSRRQETRDVRVGCSGWNYRHWRGVLYPERGSAARWLQLYSEHFDTVEVNATFYRLPAVTTVARWAQETPESFCFAVKVSRYLTHVKRLRDIRAGVALFAERIEPLVESGKLGPLLWQLPSNFHRDDERLAAALLELPPGRNAFEFRHESWFDEAVYSLLDEHGVALVTADSGGASPPPRALDAAGWSYLRFHHGQGAGGRYTRSEIARWAERIGETHGDVHAYFNNDWEGHAVRNALELAAASNVRNRASAASRRRTSTPPPV